MQLCVDIGSHVISEYDEPVPSTMGDVFSTLEKLGIIGEHCAQQLDSIDDPLAAVFEVKAGERI